MESNFFVNFLIRFNYLKHINLKRYKKSELMISKEKKGNLKFYSYFKVVLDIIL